MGNALKENLDGKVVLIDAEYLIHTLAAPEKRCFEVRGGFGAHPQTSGQALFGTFLFDGEECRMEGYQVERLATDEEIAKAKALRDATADGVVA